jgi:uncharacterized protein HemX
MPTARRKQFNSIEAASLARWIVLTAFIAATGLIYVYLTLQLHHLGERKRALETELASLSLQNESTNGQIVALTSIPALKQREKEGYLKMVPIAERNIVRVNVPQTVVNDRSGR